MPLCHTDYAILKTVASLAGMPTTGEIYGSLPENIVAARKNLSSRLCELRGRGYVRSRSHESGANQWELTPAGEAALADTEADISGEPGIPVSEQHQPDSADISPDISPDPIAADFAAAIEAADEVVAAADLPDFPANPPFCADAATAWATENGVSDDLVNEANSLKMGRPFQRLSDALYVLNVLADFIGDRPAMVYELDRIADYLEATA